MQFIEMVEGQADCGSGVVVRFEGTEAMPDETTVVTQEGAEVLRCPSLVRAE